MDHQAHDRVGGVSGQQIVDSTSLPLLRRRQARQWEWAEQIELAAQLGELLDPACVFWTAVDNQSWSKVAGILRKKRGCRSGTPDLLVLCKGRVIFLELKSLIGRLSRAQKEVRLEIPRAGGTWWMCRTARALVALHRSGVTFRRRWQPPVLEPWEEPVADPELPMVQHPEVLREWRDDKERWRARARESTR